MSSDEVSVQLVLVAALEELNFVESPTFFPPLDKTPETVRDGQFTVYPRSWGPVKVTPSCKTTPETFDIVIDFVAHARAPQEWFRREVSPRISSLVDALVKLTEVNRVEGRYSPATDSLVITATISVGTEHDR